MNLVFLDIDTQFDFIDPSGALYVDGAENITGNLKKLTEYGTGNNIPIISTRDTHTPDDPEFKDFPPRCVAGTHGQKKIEETVVKDTLKLNIIPNCHPPSFKYVNNSASCIGRIFSTDFSSMTILFSTRKSSLYPQSS